MSDGGEPRVNVPSPFRCARDAILECRGFGWTDETIAAFLNASAGGHFYPPPPGAAAWTQYMIHAHLGETGGAA